MIVPAGPPLLAYAAGSLLGWHFPEERNAYWAVLVSCVPFALVLLLVVKRPLWRSLPILFCLFPLAALRTSLHLLPEFPRNHLVRQASGRKVLLEGVLCRRPEVHIDFTRLAVEARTLRSSEGEMAVQGRADLWVSGRTTGLRAGDILLAETRLKTPRRFGNPGEIDRKARSFLAGVHVRGSVEDGRHLVRLGVAEGYRVERFVQGVRSRLGVFFEREPDPKVRGLLRAWFLGDRSSLPESLVEAFRASGLAHLLAISGLHVGLVCLFSYRVVKSLLKRFSWILLRLSAEKISVLGSLPFVLSYVLLVGSPISAVRAAAMFAVLAGSVLLDRVRAVWNSLAVAALAILLWDPAALFSASFLLSFAAVAGLLAAASAWKPLPHDGPGQGIRRGRLLCRRAWEWGWRLFTASLAATIATAPLTAIFFQRITPLAVFVNLVVVPLVGWLVLPFGLVAVVASLVSMPAATAFLAVASAGARWVASLAEACAEIPWASLWVGRPTMLELVVFYLFFFASLRPRGSFWRRWVLPGCAVAFCWSSACSIVRDRSEPHLAVTFLSVGQGDSILVEFPKGARMLVDGGTARRGAFDAGKSVVSPFLGYRRIRRLEYMVASHGQADHYGGLYFLVEQLGPEELWIGPELGCEAEGYREFLDLCRRKGVRIRMLCQGMEALSVHGVEVEVLHPPCETTRGLGPSRGCGEHINDRSVVMRLTLGQVCVLLTGDIEGRAEKGLLADPERLRALLLKVPHHGSPGSSSGAFLNAVAPALAVVSTGYRNRFGFPSAEVLRRYRERGVVLYRTDLDGAVRLKTDGRTVWLETFLGWGRPTVNTAGSSCVTTAGRP